MHLFLLFQLPRGVAEGQRDIRRHSTDGQQGEAGKGGMSLSLGTTGQCALMVGRTPWSAADAPVGLRWTGGAALAAGKRVQGAPRGPGGPPHHSRHPLSFRHPHFASIVTVPPLRLAAVALTAIRPAALARTMATHRP